VDAREEGKGKGMSRKGIKHKHKKEFWGGEKRRDTIESPVAIGAGETVGEARLRKKKKKRKEKIRGRCCRSGFSGSRDFRCTSNAWAPFFSVAALLSSL